MIRTLLTTTALAAALTTGALAADNMTKSESQTSRDGAGVAVFIATPVTKPMESVNGYYTADPKQVLATNLIGKTLYSGTGEDAESIGDVNDVVLSPNGEAKAVVVGVGGFLGMGEKDVAIDFERVNWTERDGERWLTANASKQELESAPAFDRSVFQVKNDNTAKLDVTTSDDQVEKMAAESRAADENQDMAQTDMDNGNMAARVGTDNGDMNSQAETGNGKVTARTQMDNGDMTARTATDNGNMDNAAPDAMAQAGVANTDELLGTSVIGANDEDVGEVSEVVVSDNGKVKAFIIDVGGFLGIGEKPVALDAENLDIQKSADGELRIYTDYTSEQLEAMPEYSGTPDRG